MIDSFGRRIEYLRVSVTDRCNYRCFYCMPEGNAPCTTRSDALNETDMVRVIALFAELGVSKVRITGGEPLVRRDLSGIVTRVRAIGNIEEISLSTNGHLLDSHASALKNAGLDRVNISLDSLDPAVFRAITGHHALHRVLEGIDAAQAAGLEPVKVNTVVMKGVNDNEIEALVDYSVARGLELRFIETMPLGGSSTMARRHFMGAEAILERVRAHCGADLIPVKGGHGAGPARYYQLGSGPARVGIISAISQHFCDGCNRVRLTSTGDLVLCLGNEGVVPLGKLLRSGAPDDVLRTAIIAGIARKPARHTFEVEPSSHQMFRLGG